MNKYIAKIKDFWAGIKSSRFSRAVRTLCAWQPLTFRGVIAVLLGTLAVRVFAIPELDLIADVLGKAILALTVITVFIAFVVRLMVGKRLSAEVFFDTSNALSQTPIPSGIVLTGSNLPVYFALKARRVFLHDGPAAFTHVVKGKAPEDGKRYLLDEISFPHRGMWEMSGVAMSLEDALGLTRFTWWIELQGGVEISAPTLDVAPLPIVASSARAGDQLSQSRERAGDMFDIKQYDPSDGIKRILWKTYAKSGQLVVRRPEPSVIPEGEVAIFLVARPEEDYVAGALQGYLEQLIENQIVVLFGTDGMSSIGTSQFTMEEGQIRKAINRSVWDRDCGSGKGFGDFLGALQGTGRVIHQVIVFAGMVGDWFESVSRVAGGNSVKLTVAMVPEKLDPRVVMEEFERAERVRRLPRVVRGAPAGVRKVLGLVVPDLRGGDARAGKVGRLSREVVGSGSEMLVVEGREG